MVFWGAMGGRRVLQLRDETCDLEFYLTINHAYFRMAVSYRIGDICLISGVYRGINRFKKKMPQNCNP